jgi:acetyl-CoA acyltransferase
MKEAVIVSAVRSAVGRGKKDGALSGVHPTELSACVMRGAIERAGVDAALVDDIFWGCAMPEASQGLNVARLSSLRAGIPDSVRPDCRRSLSPRRRSCAAMRTSRWPAASR